MTKRQKLIVLWLASIGQAAVEQERRGGNALTQCDWSGFRESDADPVPDHEEIQQALHLLSNEYHTKR